MRRNSEIIRDLLAAAVYSLLLHFILSSWTVVVSTGDIQYASLSVTSAVVCFKVFNSSLDCEVSSIGNLGSYGVLSQFMVFTGFALCILNHFILVPMWKRYRVEASPRFSNRVLVAVCATAAVSCGLLFFQIAKVWTDFVSDWQSRNKDKLQNTLVTQTNYQSFTVLWVFLSVVITYGFRDNELKERRTQVAPQAQPEHRSEVKEQSHPQAPQALQALQDSDLLAASRTSESLEPIELSGIEQVPDDPEGSK